MVYIKKPMFTISCLQKKKKLWEDCFGDTCGASSSLCRLRWEAIRSSVSSIFMQLLPASPRLPAEKPVEGFLRPPALSPEPCLASVTGLHFSIWRHRLPTGDLSPDVCLMTSYKHSSLQSSCPWRSPHLWRNPGTQIKKDFPGGASHKESTCWWGRHWRWGFSPWVEKIPWRRKWQPVGSQRVRHDLATGTYSTHIKKFRSQWEVWKALFMNHWVRDCQHISVLKDSRKITENKPRSKKGSCWELDSGKGGEAKLGVCPCLLHLLFQQFFHFLEGVFSLDKKTKQFS